MAGGSFEPPQSHSFGPPHFRRREGGERGREGAKGGVQTSGFGIGGREGARGVGGGERGEKMSKTTVHRSFLISSITV